MKRIISLILLLLMFFSMFMMVGCSGEDDASSKSNIDKDNIPPIVKYSVTFDYNDGSGRKDIIQIPEGYVIDRFAPDVVNGNSEIVGWCMEKSGTQKYLGKIEAEITLYGIWEQFEVTKYGSDFPETVSDRFVEIELDGDSHALSGRALHIAPACRCITIKSDGTIYDNFSIIVNSRNNAINLIFKDFSYTSNSESAFLAVNESSDNPMKLNLCLEGINIIDSSNATWSAGARAADCIRANDIKIFGTGSLKLIAGNGKDGEDKPTADEGQNGSSGGNAQNGGYGIVADKLTVEDCMLNVYGGDGGHGGNGGNGHNTDLWMPATGSEGKYKAGGSGGNGGNGGIAIDAKSITCLRAMLVIESGDGGKGGNGGNGGGSSATFGGYGGNGGNGGVGGDLFSANESGIIITECQKEFKVGVGGVGGAAGSSANDGKYGTKGKDGLNGKSNIY